VALHAAVQWLGARRLGIRLLPRVGWRDPEVRRLVRRLRGSLGYGGLNMLRWFAVLVAANRVPGGVVAFQLALNFFYLPVVLGAQPVALALLPQLSRLHQAQDLRRFGEEFTRGIALAHFVTTPAAVAYLIFAEQLAAIVSFGEMATAAGVGLLTVALAALAPGIVGDSRFQVGLHGSYACHDTRSPLRSMALCTAVSLLGVLVAFLLPAGTVVILATGLAYSAGDLVGGYDLTRRVNRRLPPHQERAAPAMLRALAASALMAGPAYLVAAKVATWTAGHLAHFVQLLAAAGVGMVLYVAAQGLWRSPELRSLLAAARTARGGAVVR
jgi:putative peptidoglycan lipid II flippase